MVAAETHANLATASARRSTNARTRAREALRRLDHEASPITFTAVADAARVSRSFLYRDPELRSELERLRDSNPDPRRSTSPRVPTAQQATNASLTQRIENLLDDLQTLRTENIKLRHKLAAVLGEERAATLNHRTATPTPGTDPVGYMSPTQTNR